MINWPTKKLGEVIVKSTNSPEIKRQNYNKSGKFPIIDQSQAFIAGYSNDGEFLFKGKLPVIVFGDHTRILKYVDFPFIRGADGTKIITANRDFIDPHFLFYILSSIDLENKGYARHYQYLLQKNIIVPPLETQQKIVEKLDTVQNYKKLLLKQESLLKELFDSVLYKSMNGEMD